MGRQERAEVLVQLDEKLDGASSVVVAAYGKINAEKSLELRKKCKEVAVDFFVVKNTLASMALKEKGMSELAPYFVGPMSVAVSKGDPVAPSKVLTDFLDGNPDLLEIKAGYVEGKFADEAQLGALASLPSRDVLLGKMVGSIKSPLSGLVGVLSGPVRNLVGVLSSIKNSKE